MFTKDTDGICLNNKTLSQISLFNNLSLGELQRVDMALSSLELPAHAPLLFLNEVGPSVYFVLSGTVCIYRPQLSERRFILNIIGAGETIGEMCALDHQGHSAHALTTESCTLLRMQRADFQAFVQDIPMLSLNLHRLLVARLRFASAHNEALAPYDVQRRIARLLLALADRYRTGESTEPIEIPLRLTQLELAEMTGVCRQRVSLTIKALHQAGCLELQTNYRICITNRSKLLQHCQ